MSDFITPDDVRTHLGTQSGELANDAMVQDYIDAAIPVIESLSQPITVVNRTVIRDGGGVAVTTPWPFQSVVSVTEIGRTLNAGDYDADGETGIVYRGQTPNYFPWYAGLRTVTIVVAVGLDSPLGNVRLATLELVRHLWQTRQANRGQAGANSPDMVVTPAGYAVPNRVVELLRPTPPFPGFG